MRAATPITSNKVVLTIIILATYFLGQFGHWWLSPLYLQLVEDLSPVARGVISNVLYFGIVPLLGMALIFGRQLRPSVMGLDKGFGKGLYMAFLMTLPMLIGYAFCSDFTINLSANDFYFGTLSAPFFEEFFFRAFLFGMLYRYAGWKVLPATVLDALVFGLIHISQGEDFASSASVFAVTAAGAAGFSLIYKEWEWNLWLVVFLHALMNFYWMVFDMAENAAGGLWANVFRIMTVAIAVIWTVRHVKQVQARTQEQIRLKEQGEGYSEVFAEVI